MHFQWQPLATPPCLFSLFSQFSGWGNSLANFSPSTPRPSICSACEKGLQVGQATWGLASTGAHPPPARVMPPSAGTSMKHPSQPLAGQTQRPCTPSTLWILSALPSPALDPRPPSTYPRLSPDRPDPDLDPPP
uniref:Uncharacterized protein n=2 Tax=Eutreptiella gymnastica TaxID=73025 RepID=A0A7S1JI85_9EUGL